MPSEDYVLTTDSCSSLPRDVVEELGLKILPYSYILDDEVLPGYVDGEDIDLASFYAKMRSGSSTKTSQPSLGQVLEFFRPILESGKDVLHVSFSSGLSAGCSTCFEAAEMLESEFPGRRVRVVDSLAACLGEGFLVYLAARKREEDGLGLDELAQWVENNKLHLAHWFTVDDLVYLFRGGRVSKTSAYAGNLMNIKPVLHVDDEGHLVPMEKVRGRRKSIKKMLDHMEASGTAPLSGQTVFIGQGDCMEDAEHLAKQVKERFGVADVRIGYTSPVIGAHSGPGTLALFFLAERR